MDEYIARMTREGVVRADPLKPKRCRLSRQFQNGERIIGKAMLDDDALTAAYMVAKAEGRAAMLEECLAKLAEKYNELTERGRLAYSEGSYNRAARLSDEAAVVSVCEAMLR